MTERKGGFWEKGFEAYQVNWSWNKKTDKWLQKMCIGRTLNFPCGMSKVGDVRADLDPSVKPDVIADLLNPIKWPWKRLEFDTVVCDPPFSFYSKFKWIFRLRDLTKRRIILSTPAMDIRLGKQWKREIWATSQCTIHTILRLWQIFTLKNKMLDDFNGL